MQNKYAHTLVRNKVSIRSILCSATAVLNFEGCSPVRVPLMCFALPACDFYNTVSTYMTKGNSYLISENTFC
jgi:hypothetical protein